MVLFEYRIHLHWKCLCLDVGTKGFAFLLNYRSSFPLEGFHSSYVGHTFLGDGGGGERCKEQLLSENVLQNIRACLHLQHCSDTAAAPRASPIGIGTAPA